MSITRRQVLKSAATTATIIASTSHITAVQAQSNGITGNFIRRDVNSLGQNDRDILSYRKAVEVMKSLPTSDPLSWEAQAEIHLNHCPHGNWFFLPWHRAYLHQFEAIIREISGDNDFALPYWDWTRNSLIPPQFWGSNNSLSHPRKADQTTSMPSEFVGEDVIKEIMEKTDFEDFASYKSDAPRGNGGGSGDLEFKPHNRVHGTIGMDMASYLSPLDPIFWLHHCNIDRIWASWNSEGNANTSDPDLLDHIFENQFFDANGSSHSYPVSETYSTTKMGYMYDRLERAGRTVFSNFVRSLGTGSIIETSEFDISRSVSAGTALSATLSVNQFQTERVSETGRFKSLARISNIDNDSAPQISIARLTVDGLEAPENEAAFIRLFLNCDYLTTDTSIDDPHYVTSAAFFASEGHSNHDQSKGVRYIFDLTETIDSLRRIDSDFEGKITPQIIAINPDGSGAELNIDGKFQIDIETFG